MSVLQALDGYYARMAARNEVDTPGFSREKISFAIVLSADGEPVEIKNLRDNNAKKPQPQLMAVPPAVKRTAGVAPNTFWDKTSYTLGRTAGEGRRTAEEHEAFKAQHRALLAGATDAGLVALLRFLDAWTPERFDAAPFSTDMLDTNIIFRLDGDYDYIHDRPEAQALLVRAETDGADDAFCLVTGERAPVRRLHPTIKGVQGAQTAGAALVSFNLDAFTSYGKVQGANAPTSEAAAFRYGTALNRMLERGTDNRNRLARPLGDSTVVFWADTSPKYDPEEAERQAKATETAFGRSIDPPPEAEDFDDVEAATLNDALDKVAEGRPVEHALPDIDKDTTFHVLGLSPNAARLSVRYWVTDKFEAFARRLGQHHADLKIEPAPRGWKTPPSVSRLLVKTTALQEKFENIPNALAGETMRAILTGGAYPRTLLAAAIIRLRAGDDPGTGWHAAVIKACLTRDFRLGFKGEADERRQIKEPPVSLDRDNKSDAYQLGRLFAALETAQRLALGKVNATIRDRYFGAASATPAGVFPLLLRGVQNHTAKLRKGHKDVWIEKEIGEIVDRLPPELPRSLKLEAQGRFAIGYYHQRQSLYAKNPKLAEPETAEDNDNEEGNEE